MKVKELIDLLSKEDLDADVCVDNCNVAEVFTGSPVIIESGGTHYSYGEIEQDIVNLIRWKDSCSDLWGEDLLYRVVSGLQSKFERGGIPQEHVAALDKFNSFDEPKQFATVRKVLDIKDGEGYPSH